MSWYAKACRKCVHRDECLVNGMPDELSLQNKSNRLGGIFLPKDCPLRESEKKHEGFIFR